VVVLGRDLRQRLPALSPDDAGLPVTRGAGAVANAVYAALGHRFDSLPMSPPKVLEALEPAEA
jgi:hypothetical protein